MQELTVIDRRCSKQEARHARRDLLPAEVLDDPVAIGLLLSILRIVGTPLGRDEQIGVCNARRPDLERFAGELVLRVDLHHASRTISERCPKMSTKLPRTSP